MKRKMIGILLLFPMLLEAQSLVEKLDSDDLSSAIKMLGIEAFKYDFGKQDIQYSLTVHVDELVDGSITKSKSYQFGNWTTEQLKKELKFFSRRTSDTSSTYWFKFSHPNMETTERFVLPAEFRKIPHSWKQIAPGEIVYDKKVPLLFYGMNWEGLRKGRKVMLFCWGEEITREMDDPILKKVRHMFLISYELKK